MKSLLLRLLLVASIFTVGRADDTWTSPTTGKVFKTGAALTPRWKLQAAHPFVPVKAAPPQFAYVPKFRSMFGNSTYGDCVSAEEAFAKTCVNPEIFNSQSIVDNLSTVCISWARSHGVLNGAALDEVLDAMASKGYQLGAQLYNDGPKLGVDYSNESVLQAAIAQGPVKVAIAANSLPGGAGSNDGWYSLTARSRNTDHSVTICGYGTATWLYQQLNTPLPSGLPGTTNGYLLYTWSTIGFVSHDWIMGTVDEAWLRTPTTIGVPPLTPPTPIPPTPTPPGPTPNPIAPIQLILDSATPAGTYIIIPKVTP